MEKINFKLTILLTMSLAAQLLMEDMDTELRFEGVDATVELRDSSCVEAW